MSSLESPSRLSHYLLCSRNISAKGFRHGKLVEDIGAVLGVAAAGLRSRSN